MIFSKISVKIVFCGIILLTTILACERIVFIDLNEAEPKVVIEGVVSNLDSGVFVNLSYTTTYYNLNSSAPPIRNAKIIINDSEGNQELLNETDLGHYEANIIKGVPGRTYYLLVDIDGEVYEARSTMKAIPVLDSLSFEKRLFYDMDNQTIDTSYYPFCHFVDPIQANDNYRLKLYKYLKNKIHLVDFIYLFEDELMNGDTIHYGDYARFNTKGTRVIIELINMDQHVYDYFFVLSQALNSNLSNGSIVSSSPTNPPSNITNGALGYFGALAIAVKDTIAQ